MVADDSNSTKNTSATCHGVAPNRSLLMALPNTRPEKPGGILFPQGSSDESSLDSDRGDTGHLSPSILYHERFIDPLILIRPGRGFFPRSHSASLHGSLPSLRGAHPRNAPVRDCARPRPAGSLGGGSRSPLNPAFPGRKRAFPAAPGDARLSGVSPTQSAVLVRWIQKSGYGFVGDPYGSHPLCMVREESRRFDGEFLHRRMF